MVNLPRIGDVKPKIEGVNSANQLNIGGNFIAAKIEIDLWSSLEEGDLIELVLDGRTILASQKVRRKSTPSSELTLEPFSIPKAQLPLGVHTLAYKHTAKDQIGSSTAAQRFTPPNTFVVIGLPEIITKFLNGSSNSGSMGTNNGGSRPASILLFHMIYSSDGRIAPISMQLTLIAEVTPASGYFSFLSLTMFQPSKPAHTLLGRSMTDYTTRVGTSDGNNHQGTHWIHDGVTKVVITIKRNDTGDVIGKHQLIGHDVTDLPLL